MGLQRRLQLQQLLEELAGDGVAVHFQPPPNLQMTYPCIVYKRDYADSKFAGNGVYSHTKRYLVTVIDQDPDSEIPERVAQLPQCLFTRHFAVDQLNHDIYSLYF